MKIIPLKACLCLLLYAPVNAKALSARVYTFAPVCNPTVTVVSLSNTTDCFSLSSQVINPGDPDSYYSWSFGDGSPNETGRTLNHCYASETVPGNTTRTVTLNYSNPALNCVGSSSTTLNVSVVPASPCPNVPPGFTLAASTVTVWAGSTIPEIVTRYDFGDGTGTHANYIHTYSACGNYIVHVSSWDMNTPNTVCHSYTAINISCSVPTGSAERTSGRFISVFPNPTEDVIYVKAGEPVKSVTIIDLLGKTILSETDMHHQMPVLRLSHVPAGSYFMHVELDSGAQQILPVIKH